jgi:hypothetical protein
MSGVICSEAARSWSWSLHVVNGAVPPSPYIFTTWYLIKRGDNFTFSLRKLTEKTNYESQVCWSLCRDSSRRLPNAEPVCYPQFVLWQMSCDVNLHVTCMTAYGRDLRLFVIYFWDVIRESRTWSRNVDACTGIQWSVTSLSLYGKGCDEMEWLVGGYRSLVN